MLKEISSWINTRFENKRIFNNTDYYFKFVLSIEILNYGL